MTVIRRFRAILALVVCACLLAVASACGNSTTGPAPNAPFSQTDVRVGVGAAAANGNTLVVNYTGWLYDSTKPENKGLQFDSSAGRTPLEFILGQGQVIAGWDQGLLGLRVGGLRRLIIPPSLGYGGARQGPIPANAGLVFDVELLEIK